MEDPFLNYFALGLLFFVVIVLVYGIIAIHDIPARIAKARHHPHEDAIHAAGWISLFMLHVLWPFLWIWATARPAKPPSTAITFTSCHCCGRFFCGCEAGRTTSSLRVSSSSIDLVAVSPVDVACAVREARCQGRGEVV